MISALIVLLFAASSVSAHGNLMKGMYKDKIFTLTDSDNPIRKVSSQNPNTDKNSDALTCGPDAKLAPGVLSVQAGDKIRLFWTAGDGSYWRHDTGPIIAYMASCGSSPCNEFDQSSARFFKIGQLGKKGNTDVWYQSDLMNGGPSTYVTVTIPKNLLAGNYLLRHEIIALHQQPREFYPACVQLKVTGNGKDSPSDGDLVKIPGAYHEDDDGFNNNIYDGNGAYNFPGPPIPEVFRSGSNRSPRSTSKPPASTPGVNTNADNPSSTSLSPPSDSNVGTKKPGASDPTSMSTMPTPSPNYPRRQLNRIMRRGKVDNEQH